MAKVFFVDAGSIDQLNSVIDTIEATATGRASWLAAETERTQQGETHIEQEVTIIRRARRAREQVSIGAAAPTPDGNPAEALHGLLDDMRSLLSGERHKESLAENLQSRT